MADILILHNSDTVAVALRPLAAGDRLRVTGHDLVVRDSVPRGHKVALGDLPAGSDVIKYGEPIGRATTPIPAGAWVHTHNLTTNLGPSLSYHYDPRPDLPGPGTPTRTFRGFRRANGQVGVRNDLYIVPTVGCINSLCAAMAQQFEADHGGRGSFDSIVVTRHPYGCSQLGGDLDMTRRILRDVAAHPNAGGVLVVGLGCENNQIDELRAGMGDVDPARVRFLVAQEVDDELEAAAGLLDDLNRAAASDTREDVPISALRVGLKCGGSDGFSGITANPLIGRFADWLVGQGGSAVLTEVPEMFGAEHLLMTRSRDEETFTGVVELIDGFKDYFRRYGQPIYENPSPGNKAGGISTLEEKSLGCTQKSGTSRVEDVLAYGDRVRRPGLSLLRAPGNDLVSSSALASAGCQIVLFSTGRGTPFGTYVPTVKIASTSELAARKPRWIDFDAGQLLDVPMDQVADRFRDLILDVVTGLPTCNERYGMQEIAIFKDGVTE